MSMKRTCAIWGRRSGFGSGIRAITLLAGKRPTLNAQHSINRQSKIQNRKWIVPGGRTRKAFGANPESFRGCSTVANNKLRVSDFSFARESALLIALHLRSRPVFSPRFRFCYQGAWWSRYGHVGAARTVHRDQQRNQ